MSTQKSNKTGLHSSAEKDSVREDADEQHGKGSPVDGATGGRKEKTGQVVEDVTSEITEERMQGKAEKIVNSKKQ